MPVRTPKIPAPVGGWNTRDPIALMQPTDSVSMTNVIPDIDGCSIRPGYTQTHELVASSNQFVNFLHSWRSQHGERLIAACPTSASNHKLYDITTSTVTEIKAGYFSSKWKASVMNQTLALVNGADNAQKVTYTPSTGTVVQDLSLTPQPVNPFDTIHVYKSRSYFASSEEPAFWYSEINALGGTITKFPIDRVADSSGNVIDIKSWTRDGGSGPDDYFVIFLDTGEVLVYTGSNPGDASDWSIVGRYKLGKVLATTQFGGKIHVVTDEDYNTLPDDLIAEGIKSPTKLSGAARDAVRKDQTKNWQILFDVQWGWRIVNVPAGTKREQHILNLRSGGACRTNFPANVWARHKGELYFGDDTATIYRVREGDDNGAAIEWSVQQAYTDFQAPGYKSVKNYRPLWTTNGTFTWSSGLAYDYDSTSFIQTHTESEDGPVWDTAPWETSLWGKGQGSKINWQSGAGGGEVVSLFQNGSSTKRCTWHTTNYRVETGSDVF
jgi:hypothetical protein